MRHEALLAKLLTDELDNLLWGEDWRTGGSNGRDRSDKDPAQLPFGRKQKLVVDSPARRPRPDVKFE